MSACTEALKVGGRVTQCLLCAVRQCCKEMLEKMTRSCHNRASVRNPRLVFKKRNSSRLSVVSGSPPARKPSHRWIGPANGDVAGRSSRLFRFEGPRPFAFTGPGNKPSSLAGSDASARGTQLNHRISTMIGVWSEGRSCARGPLSISHDSSRAATAEDNRK